MLKLFLDDERATPEGWVRCYWPEDVIRLLETVTVSVVSLDHDLGDDAHGTGYDVLLWVEQAVVLSGFKPPKLQVHSANSAARQRMLAAIEQIERRAAEQEAA